MALVPGKRGVDAEIDGGEIEEKEVGRRRTSGCASDGFLMALFMLSRTSIRWVCLRWIPRPMSFKVLSPPIREENSLVYHLKTVSGSWNGPLINEIFIEEDARAILSIPSSISTRDDSYCWHFTKYGEYSVSSGYKVCVDLDIEEFTSSDQGVGFCWDKLVHGGWPWLVEEILPCYENFLEEFLVVNALQGSNASISGGQHPTAWSSPGILVWWETFPPLVKRSVFADLPV
ncbi:hypothetical protein QYF36_014025 [Acer negundo]|nr:hypothetical protein QYF36_014025 [Acer negundo]